MLILSAASALWSGSTASGQQFLVNRAVDDAAPGSLRWAINEANAFPGAATINFSSALTVGLIDYLPPLTNRFGITINGNNSILDGGASTQGYVSGGAGNQRRADRGLHGQDRRPQ